MTASASDARQEKCRPRDDDDDDDDGDDGGDDGDDDGDDEHNDEKAWTGKGLMMMTTRRR